MTTEHPITPSPELIRQWLSDLFGYEVSSYQLSGMVDHADIATAAAQWGADQELEACINEIYRGVGLRVIDYSSNRELLCSDLRSARRPKPLSMKEQAIEALKTIATDQAPHEEIVECFKVVRSALDSLSND